MKTGGGQWPVSWKLVQHPREGPCAGFSKIKSRPFPHQNEIPENAGACPSAEVKLREDESRQTNQTQLLLWRRQKIFVSDGTTFKQTQAPLLYK